MQLELIVIKYKEPMSVSERAFKHPDDNYVALDTNSGGYPYRTSVLRAERWKTVEDAFKYIDYDSCREQFEVVQLNLTVNEQTITPPWNNVDA